jgi:hypothetical protein
MFTSLEVVLVLNETFTYPGNQRCSSKFPQPHFPSNLHTYINYETIDSITHNH